MMNDDQNWAKGPSGKQKQGRLPGQMNARRKKEEDKKEQKERGKEEEEEKKKQNTMMAVGEGGEEEEEENGVKNLRIDFLHSKMPQVYPFIHSFIH